MRKRKFEYACTNIELVENYELAKADNFKGWICHHRLETHNSDGEKRLVPIKMEELKALGMYYDRPPEELIFLRTSEHSRMHALMQVRYEETKEKISTTKKGKPSWNKGKKHSEEHKANLRAAWEIRKARKWEFSDEAKAKLSAARKGMKLKMVDGKRVYYRPEEIK